MRDRAMDAALALVAAGVLMVDANTGKVWRVGRFLPDGTVRRLRWRRRAENVGGGGYLRVTWREGRGVRQVMAHRLVWAVVNGAAPAELQLDHRNMNRKDNRPANLEVVTQSENIRRRFAMRRCASAAA